MSITMIFNLVNHMSFSPGEENGVIDFGSISDLNRLFSILLIGDWIMDLEWACLDRQKQ